MLQIKSIMIFINHWLYLLIIGYICQEWESLLTVSWAHSSNHRDIRLSDIDEEWASEVLNCKIGKSGTMS